MYNLKKEMLKRKFQISFGILGFMASFVFESHLKGLLLDSRYLLFLYIYILATAYIFLKHNGPDINVSDSELIEFEDMTQKKKLSLIIFCGIFSILMRGVTTPLIFIASIIPSALFMSYTAYVILKYNKFELYIKNLKKVNKL